MRRKGSTNKELLTWKWDLLSPWILAGMEEWGRMQTFSEQPSGQRVNSRVIERALPKRISFFVKGNAYGNQKII